MATSTKKKDGPKPPPKTEDVPHEVVPFTPDSKPAAPLKIYTTAEITQLYLQQLSPAELQLAELEQKYAATTGPIAVTDKVAYKAAKDAWREVQAFRTRVENQALSMRREQNTINKAIACKESEIVTRATPLEERLQQRWKAVDDENERLEREENDRQERQLRERLDDLASLGMTMTDGYYAIGDRVTVDVATLRTMPLDKYNNFRRVVVNVSNELQQAEERRQREEQERQQQLEQERQQARQANKETRSMVLDALGLVPQEDGTLLWTDGVHRLVESEEKLYDLDHYGFTKHVKIIKDNIKEFQEKKRREEQQERERQERIEKQNRWAARTHALRQAGLTERAGDFIYSDGFNPELKVFGDELAELDDATFSARVVELSNEVGELRTKFNRNEEEKARKARELKLRKDELARALQVLNFTYELATESFVFTHPLYAVRYTWEQLLKLDKPQFQELLEREKERIADAKQRQAKLDKDETERLERERLAGLNDAQLFKEYIDRLKAVTPPNLNTSVGKKRAAQFAERLSTLLGEFMPKTSGNKEVAP